MSASPLQAHQLEAGNGGTGTDTEGFDKPSSSAGTVVDEPAVDPSIVDWDGPDDPANPLNWPSSKKNFHVALVSLFTLAANLAATMFAPGASELATDFGITNSTVEAMTVSLYVFGFALGPLMLAPLSELYGRLIVYIFCNIVYIGFTVGCAFSTDVAMFLVFRIICGCAASGPMSIGGGTVADLFPQEKRGKAMAMFTTGPLLGPSGFIGVATVIFMRETSHAVLLRRKMQRLRNETGNEKLRPKLSREETPKQMFARAIVRPVKLLIFSPIVLLISLYTGILFGLIFLLFTTFPDVFEDVYGFDPGVAGLAYIGLGIGMVLGLVLFSILSDKLLGQGKSDKTVRPEDRLILMKWFGPITPIGLFIYGWTARGSIHWIVPILGTFVVGLGALFVVIPGQIYLVDAFGAEAAASAMAANLLVRSPFGAFLDLTASPLYEKLGLGWGNSVLGFICLAFTPVPWLFYTFGERLRTRFQVNL